MTTSHKYKIGQKVRSLKNGQDYFIIGIKTTGVYFSQTELIVHFEKNKPSRFGFVVFPSQVELLANG